MKSLHAMVEMANRRHAKDCSYQHRPASFWLVDDLVDHIIAPMWTAVFHSGIEDQD